MSGVKCATLVALSVAVSEEAFPRQLGAESLIEKVCKDTGLDDLCSKSIRLPTGVTMSYKDACAHNVCTWPCGQKQCTNNCCPYTTKTCNNKCCCWGFLKCGCSKSKCGEWCVNTPHFTCNKDKCGETCVDIPCSGVSKEHCGETCVKVPDSLAINWKDASPCEHFSKLKPMLKTAEMACACLGALSDFLKHVGDFQSSEPSSVALNAASRMVGCLVKEGFHVQDDKAEVVHELTNGDDYIIQAAPVDLEKYVEMTTAVAACASTGACHLIHTALLDYFKPVATDVGNGVEDFLETFVLDSLLSPLAAAADVPLMLAEDLPQSLQCTADAAEAAFQDVKGKIEEVKDFFQDLKKKVETLQQGCQKAIEAVGGLADSLDTSVQNIVQNLLDGQVPLVDAVKQIKDLAEVKELLNALSQLKAEVADVKKRAEELDDLKMSLQDLAKSDDCGLKDVLEDLQDIPSLLSQVSDPLKKIQQLDINANSVQAGVVSYNQWVDFNLDLPCSKMELWTASLEGLSVSAHIPKFYACNFGYTLPLPNEHIPYLRIKKAAKALS